jgi:hypothetical protein
MRLPETMTYIDVQSSNKHEIKEERKEAEPSHRATAARMASCTSNALLNDVPLASSIPDASPEPAPGPLFLPFCDAVLPKILSDRPTDSLPRLASTSTTGDMCHFGSFVPFASATVLGCGHIRPFGGGLLSSGTPAAFTSFEIAHMDTAQVVEKQHVAWNACASILSMVLQ